jgi:hypothetical protein
LYLGLVFGGAQGRARGQCGGGSDRG